MTKKIYTSRRTAPSVSKQLNVWRSGGIRVHAQPAYRYGNSLTKYSRIHFCTQQWKRIWDWIITKIESNRKKNATPRMNKTNAATKCKIPLDWPTSGRFVDLALQQRRQARRGNAQRAGNRIVSLTISKVSFWSSCVYVRNIASSGTCALMQRPPKQSKK